MNAFFMSNSLYFYRMKEEQVILVNENDEQIGLMPKMEAHEKAVLHRAFSVFIFNENNQLMLQQRALNKYHSPGLWTNTCCSHQRDGESNVEAGKRRLQEEMGFVVELEETTSFIYKAPFENGLTEHEYDHVMIGYYDDKPLINTYEVVNWKWMKLEEVKVDIALHPELYTEWFKIIFDKFYQHINITKNEGNS
jgi:isopentenyl-diphosphate delta-isomerase